MAKWLHNLLIRFIYFTRRLNPVYRDTFDKLFRTANFCDDAISDQHLAKKRKAWH